MKVFCPVDNVARDPNNVTGTDGGDTICQMNTHSLRQNENGQVRPLVDMGLFGGYQTYKVEARLMGPA